MWLRFSHTVQVKVDSVRSERSRRMRFLIYSPSKPDRVPRFAAGEAVVPGPAASLAASEPTGDHYG